MAKVRPLSMREALAHVRGQPLRYGRGQIKWAVRDCYVITELQLRAIASAFYRKARASSTTGDKHG